MRILKKILIHRSKKLSKEGKAMANTARKMRFISGSSLMGVMMATSLAGALGLAMNEMVKEQSKSQKRLQVDFEVSLLSRLISQNLLDTDACVHTFGGVGSTVADGRVLTEIKNRLNGTLLNTSNRYGNNNVLRLDSIVLNDFSTTSSASGASGGGGKLRIVFDRLSPLIEGSTKVPQEFPLYFHFDTSGGLARCYSSLDDALNRAKMEMCTGMEGIYDTVTGMCDIAHLYVDISGDTMTGPLEIVGGDLSTDTQICLNGNCRTTFASTNCAVGEVIRKVNADGTVECGNLNCGSPNSLVYRGIDAVGNPICRSYPNKICPVGEYVETVRSDGTVACAPLPPQTSNCPLGQVVTGLDASGDIVCKNMSCLSSQFHGGLDASGNPICRDFPENICPAGQAIVSFDDKGNSTCAPLNASGVQPARCPAREFIGGIKRDSVSGSLSLECRPMSFRIDNSCTALGDRGAVTGIDSAGRVICGCRPDEGAPGVSTSCW